MISAIMYGGAMTLRMTFFENRNFTVILKEGSLGAAMQKSKRKSISAEVMNKLAN